MLENLTAGRHDFWEFEGNDVDKWFLMSSPIPVLSIWITYLAFVLKVGPAFMKNRTPFVLKSTLLVYNAIQVLISCFMLCIGSKLIFNNGLLLQRTCESDNAIFRKDLSAATYYYFFAKVTELLDTVFFVLRKKSNQVTFLHVYHHSITMLLSWITLKYDPSFSTIFLGTLNAFVHIVMYSYYGLSTFPGLAKYLWWKKYITAMQLVQFLMIALQVVVNYKLSHCRQSNLVIGVIIFNLLFFMYLFSDFYIKSYVKNNKKPSDNGEEKLYSKNLTNNTEKNGIRNNNKLINLNQRKEKGKGNL